MFMAQKQASFEVKCGKQLSLIGDLRENAPIEVSK
jgi:hypothetical protein